MVLVAAVAFLVLFALRVVFAVAVSFSAFGVGFRWFRFDSFGRVRRLFTFGGFVFSFGVSVAPRLVLGPAFAGSVGRAAGQVGAASRRRPLYLNPSA